MAATPLPNIEELKEASGSNHLSKCYKFLFVKEVTEYEAFIMEIGDKCNQLRSKIEKSEQSIREAHSFGEFHEVGATGLEFLLETQVEDQDLLEGLTNILAKAREAFNDKNHHVEVMDMDYYDDEV
jgi:hypothetical protein